MSAATTEKLSNAPAAQAGLACGAVAQERVGFTQVPIGQQAVAQPLGVVLHRLGEHVEQGTAHIA